MKKSKIAMGIMVFIIAALLLIGVLICVLNQKIDGRPEMC